MNGDIRISVNFVQHPKTKKTIRKYGHAAIVSIIALWGFAAQRRPEGNLTGMDVDDIAIAACWDGDEQEFFDMCVEMKWIDVHENGEIHLHGWKEAQGYVINAPARAERSRRAAQARWEKREKKELEQISGDNANGNASSMLDACSTHANGMPEAMRNPENGNAPSPAPFPSPSHNGNNNTPLTPQGGKCAVAEEYSDDFELFWREYPNHNSGKKKAYSAFKRALKKATLAELLKSLDAHKKSSQWTKDGGAYIPHATTWLNGERWTVELGRLDDGRFVDEDGIIWSGTKYVCNN